MKVPKIFQYYFTRKLRSSRYWGRVGLIIAFALILGLIIPRRDASGYVYEVGEPWDGETLYAPFTFSIHKTNDSVEAEKLIAQRQTFKVFQRDSIIETRNEREVLSSLEKIYVQMEAYKNALGSGDSLASSRVKNEQFLGPYNLNPDKLVLPPVAKVLSEGGRLLNRIHKAGYLGEVSKDTLGNFIALRTRPAEELVLPTAFLLNKDTLS
ncbi:MAG: hypothetical protein AAF388_28240, partial [Bacteroidota bacterium]